MRSKIAVCAREEGVDPIGSCVGHRGFRVQTIVDELHNEKIDIVEWDENPAVYIAHALSPAKVISVDVDENEKMSRVVVPDNQLPLLLARKARMLVWRPSLLAGRLISRANLRLRRRKLLLL